MSLTVTRNRSLAFVGLAIAGALAVATLSNPWLGRSVGQGINEGLHELQTVAAMLAERSPGTRPEGALANTKHKRQAALHERALPKIRGPYVPPTAYEALAGPPPPPVLVPPEAPLMALGGPEIIPPIIGGGEGGPPVLSNIPPVGGGGGGGGGFTPPIVTEQVPPPTTPAVPEPGTWAMMLLGFVLVGRALKRSPAAGPARA